VSSNRAFDLVIVTEELKVKQLIEKEKQIINVRFKPATSITKTP